MRGGGQGPRVQASLNSVLYPESSGGALRGSPHSPGEGHHRNAFSTVPVAVMWMMDWRGKKGCQEGR